MGRLFDPDPNSATYGKTLVTLRGHTGWLRAASFSPDGKRILTGSDDKTVRLWDADSKSANFGSQIALVEAGQPITAADFSPDGSRVVEVTLTEGFWLGQTEITQSQWTLLMGTSPWQGKSNMREGRNFAASFISWEDANSFVEKLNSQEHSSSVVDQQVA